MLGRLHLIAAGVIPFHLHHLTDTLFYALLFVVTGSVTEFLMAKTGEVVALRQQRAEEVLREDALTGLPNRTVLRDRLQQAARSAHPGQLPFSLLLLDLDRFKEVNDTFGHQYGDLLLQEVGTRLRSALRASDTVARLGGDEFAILLPGTDRLGATVAAEKALRGLERPFVLAGHSLHIGASLGIALCPEHGGDASALLRRADVAMYVAKRAGGGYSIYVPEEDRYSPSRLALISDLRQAIEHGQLSLHYQPKVNLATGLIDGVEALVRWHHAQHGPIPPSDFIPLAVHTGLIRPLSLWVLRTALEQSRRLHEEGLAIRVAVYQALRGMGCDVVQGYFLSRPLPPEECRRYLVEWPQRLAS